MLGEILGGESGFDAAVAAVVFGLSDGSEDQYRNDDESGESQANYFGTDRWWQKDRFIVCQ